MLKRGEDDRTLMSCVKDKKDHAMSLFRDAEALAKAMGEDAGGYFSVIMTDGSPMGMMISADEHEGQDCLTLYVNGNGRYGYSFGRPNLPSRSGGYDLPMDGEWPPDPAVSEWLAERRRRQSWLRAK